MTLPRTSKRRRARSGQPGKLGRIRLYGPAKAALRRQCWEVYGPICHCLWPLTGCGEYCGWDQDMAHLKSLGAGGSDVIENVRPMKHEHHMKRHNGGK
jgi:hypothetical protein